MSGDPPSASGTERQLGIVIGQLSAINGRLDAADASRRALHEQVNGIDRKVVELKTVVGEVRHDIDEMKPAIAEVPDIKRDVADMKPEVNMVRNVKAKAAGAILVLVSIGGILSFLITTFLVDPLKAAFVRLFH